MKIILASASPRRRELMKYIAGEFTAVSADCDETLPSGISPMNAAQYLAELKAKTIAQQYPEDIVIGCDTTVICGSEILGKPKDRQDFKAFGKNSSGRDWLLYHFRRKDQCVFRCYGC